MATTPGSFHRITAYDSPSSYSSSDSHTPRSSVRSMSSTPSMTRDDMKRLIVDKDKDIVKTREMLTKAREVIMQMKEAHNQSWSPSGSVRSNVTGYTDTGTDHSSYLSDTSGIMNTVMQVNQALTRRTETMEGLRKRLTETEDAHVVEVQRLQSRIAELQREMIHYTGRITDLESDLREARQAESENVELHETIQEMNARKEALLSEHEGNQYLMKELESKDHLILEHIARMDELEAEKTEQRDQMAEKDKQISLLNKELDIVRSELDTMRDNDESDMKQRNEISVVMKNLRREFAEKDEEMKATIRSLESELEDAQYAVGDKESNLRSKHLQDLIRMKEEVNDVAAQRDELDIKYHELDEIYNNALEDNKFLMEENENWRRRNDVMSANATHRLQETEELRSELNRLQNSLTKSEEEHRQSISALGSESKRRMVEIQREHNAALGNMHEQTLKFVDAIQRQFDPNIDVDRIKSECVEECRKMLTKFSSELERVRGEVHTADPISTEIENSAQIMGNSSQQSGFVEPADAAQNSEMNNRLTGSTEDFTRNIERKEEESKSIVDRMVLGCTDFFDKTPPPLENSKPEEFLRRAKMQHQSAMEQHKQHFLKRFANFRSGTSANDKSCKTTAEELTAAYVSDLTQAELGFSAAITQLKLLHDGENWKDSEVAQRKKLDEIGNHLNKYYASLSLNTEKLQSIITSAEESSKSEKAKEVFLGTLHKELSTMEDIKNQLQHVTTRKDEHDSEFSALYQKLTKVYWKDANVLRTSYDEIIRRQKRDYNHYNIVIVREKYTRALLDALFNHSKHYQRRYNEMEGALQMSKKELAASKSENENFEENMDRYRKKRLKFDRVLLAKLESRIHMIRSVLYCVSDTNQNSYEECVEVEEKRISVSLGEALHVLKHLIRQLTQQFSVAERQRQRLKDGIMELKGRSDLQESPMADTVNGSGYSTTADGPGQSTPMPHQAVRQYGQNSDFKLIVNHIMDIIGAIGTDSVVPMVTHLVEKASLVPQYVQFLRHVSRILEHKRYPTRKTKTMGTIVTESGDVFSIDYMLTRMREMLNDRVVIGDMNDFVQAVKSEMEKTISAAADGDRKAYEKFFYAVKILVQTSTNVVDHQASSEPVAKKSGTPSHQSQSQSVKEKLDYLKKLLQVSNTESVKSRVHELLAQEKQQRDEFKLMQRELRTFREISAQLQGLLNVESITEVFSSVKALSKEMDSFVAMYPKLQKLLTELCRTVHVSQTDELLSAVRKLMRISESVGHMFVESPKRVVSSARKSRRDSIEDLSMSDTGHSFTLDDIVDVLTQ